MNLDKLLPNASRIKQEDLIYHLYYIFFEQFHWSQQDVDECDLDVIIKTLEILKKKLNKKKK
jgi:hypothetical protein